ncbi:MAG: phosphoribosylformylglycinamidine synthase subunit PurQ [Pseudomonadota bacterium]
MRTAVVVFPGSNCDRDIAVALGAATGRPPAMVWHKDTALPPDLDLVALPGGFSFGDYLRCGAIAARAPIMPAIRAFADRGGHVLGICNGFQILIEAGLLPGALMRNAGLRFVCRSQTLTVATADSPFTAGFARGEAVRMVVAHHDGNFAAPPDLVAELQDQDRIAFRYDGNPNGSANDIAGVLSPNRRCLGLMPHPERAAEPAHGATDGARLFASLTAALGRAAV